MLTTVNDNTPQSINVSLHSLQTEIDNLQKMLDSVVKSLEGTTNYVLGEVGNIVYPVTSVNNQTGDVILTSANVGAVPLTRTVNGKALGNDIVLDPSDVSAVPITRTVNGKALSSNITLTASDVGALSSSTTHLSGDVPTTRTVNGKALSSNITLTASDVSAASSSDFPTKQTSYISLSDYKSDYVDIVRGDICKYGRLCFISAYIKTTDIFSNLGNKELISNIPIEYRPVNTIYIVGSAFEGTAPEFDFYSSGKISLDINNISASSADFYAFYISKS